jgi:hypothetical protein
MIKFAIAPATSAVHHTASCQRYEHLRGSPSRPITRSLACQDWSSCSRPCSFASDPSTAVVRYPGRGCFAWGASEAVAFYLRHLFCSAFKRWVTMLRWFSYAGGFARRTLAPFPIPHHEPFTSFMGGLVASTPLFRGLIKV